ncbi:MAG: DUF3800 domain-containing protein [Candidatus Acidiferrales bacterium]
MALFTAYFDASGTPDATAITMAGYVADVRKWKQFEGRWQEILDRERIACFHMTDFASNHGEFEGWGGRPEVRKRFISDLQECATKFTNKRFSASVVISDYNAVNKNYCLEEALGRPYSFCGISCIEHVRKWAKNRSRVKELMFAFEDGDKDQGNFKMICRERFQPAIDAAFLLKADYIPFQAADLAAWKTRHPIREAVGDKDYTMEDVERLLSSTRKYLQAPHSGGVFNYNSLMKICRDYKIRQRTKRD